MKSAVKVLKEQIDNCYLMRRLSIYELTSQNKDNYLGIAWEVINPAIQIIIYWFVFGTVRHRAPVDVSGMEVPFFNWLFAAFFLWIFFYQATIEGSKSIYTRLRMLSKMNFPMSVIPNYIIFSKFYVHLFMLIGSIIIFQFRGFYINIYYLQFVYYIFDAFCLFFSISLLYLNLSLIIMDVHMIINLILWIIFILSGL